MDISRKITDLLQNLQEVYTSSDKPSFTQIKEFRRAFKRIRNCELNLVNGMKLMSCILMYIEYTVNYFSSVEVSTSAIKSVTLCLGIILEIIHNKFIKNIFVEMATKKIFNIILDEEKLWCKKHLLIMFNNCIQGAGKAVREKTVNNIGNYYICKLLDLIGSCGDYELQSNLIETIFRIYGSTYLQSESQTLVLFPESKELNLQFLYINVESFDKEVRNFLNAFNEKSNLVVSLTCQQVVMDKIICVQPETLEEVDGLWVDLNLLEQSISWYCSLKTFSYEKIPTEEKNSKDLEQWNLVTVYFKDILNMKINRLQNDYATVIFYLKGNCISSVPETQVVIDKIKILTLKMKNCLKCNQFLHAIKKNLSEKVLTTAIKKQVFKPLDIKISSNKGHSDLNRSKAFSDSVFGKSTDSSINVNSSANFEASILDTALSEENENLEFYTAQEEFEQIPPNSPPTASIKISTGNNLDELSSKDSSSLPSTNVKISSRQREPTEPDSNKSEEVLKTLSRMLSSSKVSSILFDESDTPNYPPSRLKTSKPKNSLQCDNISSSKEAENALYEDVNRDLMMIKNNIEIFSGRCSGSLREVRRSQEVKEPQKNSTKSSEIAETLNKFKNKKGERRKTENDCNLLNVDHECNKLQKGEDNSSKKGVKSVISKDKEKNAVEEVDSYSVSTQELFFDLEASETNKKCVEFLTKPEIIQFGDKPNLAQNKSQPGASLEEEINKITQKVYKEIPSKTEIIQFGDKTKITQKVHKEVPTKPKIIQFGDRTNLAQDERQPETSLKEEIKKITQKVGKENSTKPEIIQFLDKTNLAQNKSQPGARIEEITQKINKKIPRKPEIIQFGDKTNLAQFKSQAENIEEEIKKVTQKVDEEITNCAPKEKETFEKPSKISQKAQLVIRLENIMTKQKKQKVETELLAKTVIGLEIEEEIKKLPTIGSTEAIENISKINGQDSKILLDEFSSNEKTKEVEKDLLKEVDKITELKNSTIDQINLSQNVIKEKGNKGEENVLRKKRKLYDPESYLDEITFAGESFFCASEVIEQNNNKKQVLEDSGAKNNKYKKPPTKKQLTKTTKINKQASFKNKQTRKSPKFNCLSDDSIKDSWNHDYKTTKRITFDDLLKECRESEASKSKHKPRQVFSRKRKLDNDPNNATGAKEKYGLRNNKARSSSKKQPQLRRKKTGKTKKITSILFSDDSTEVMNHWNYGNSNKTESHIKNSATPKLKQKRMRKPRKMLVDVARHGDQSSDISDNSANLRQIKRKDTPVKLWGKPLEQSFSPLPELEVEVDKSRPSSPEWPVRKNEKINILSNVVVKPKNTSLEQGSDNVLVVDRQQRDFLQKIVKESIAKEDSLDLGEIKTKVENLMGYLPEYSINIVAKEVLQRCKLQLEETPSDKNLIIIKLLDLIITTL